MLAVKGCGEFAAGQDVTLHPGFNLVSRRSGRQIQFDVERE
jgi:hypothetical protein